MNIKVSLLLLFFFSTVSNVIGRSMNEMFELLSSAEVSDELKLSINKELEDSVLTLVKSASTIGQNFANYPKLGCAVTDDKKVSVYTWGFPLEDKSYHYGCIVQSKRKKATKVQPLKIKDKAFVPKQDAKFNNQNWYGALYYQIVPVKYKKEDYYVIIGWGGFSASTNFKVIDAMKLDAKGRPSLGRLVFKKLGRPTWCRHIFQYDAEGKIAVNYDRQYKAIIFDHLSPESVMFTDIYSYYGPDFTYDSYILKEGKWYMQENVDARNKE